MRSDGNAFKSMTPRLALQLAAPHTWAASVCPALFGDFYCWQKHLSLPLWKGCLLPVACIFLQSAVNTLNDYFDYVKGTDTEEDHVEVSDATLVYSHINPKSARRLGLVYLAAGAGTGLPACIGSGWLPVMLGLVGAMVIILYSGGPLPLSYLPLGEIFSGFVMGGLIPLGTGLCADGSFHGDILFYSLPLILGIGLIMMSNNGCDIEKDIAAGRKTLPVCLGREKTLILYRLVMLLWIILIPIFSLLLTGPVISLICFGLLVIVAGKPIKDQLLLGLRAEERILQMKGINSCNIRINGIYILSLILSLLLEVYHG